MVMLNDALEEEDVKELQWVHGRITVVMAGRHEARIVTSRLQWVHGRITVVMQALLVQLA